MTCNCERLFQAQSTHRVDRRGAPRRQDAGNSRDKKKNRSGGDQRKWIARTSSGPGSDHAVQNHAQSQSDGDANAEHGCGGTKYEFHDGGGASAEGHANAQLLGALSDAKRDHAVKPSRGKDKRKGSEDTKEVGDKAFAP